MIKKIIGYGLILAYLSYFVWGIAIKYHWKALFIAPLILVFWIGLAIFISWLIK